MVKYTTQIAILGGGICGLWLHNILRKAGYSSWLFEKNTLGCAQTLASQGMVHGGLKYALGGFTTPSSETIANMPAVWKACLDGNGPVDLSGLAPLSNDYYLFSDAGLTSKITAFFASKTIKSRISTLQRSDYPAAFQHPDFTGSLYQLQDIVLDMPHLLRKLTEHHADTIFQGDAQVHMQDGKISGLTFPDQMPHNHRIVADHYIFAAGAGTEALISNTSLATIKMQTRPLHQVMLKGNLPVIYAHAVSLKAANKPRLTITSHACGNETVWYLGGNLAELGVNKSPAELINVAQQEIRDLLPWIDISHAKWATHRIDRAEPAQESGARPDFPYVESIGNASICWPTKFTLAPLLGDQVMQSLAFEPHEVVSPSPQLPQPALASTPWELAFDKP